MDRRSESIVIAVVTKCGWITYSHDVDRTDATMPTLIASTVIMVPVFSQIVAWCISTFQGTKFEYEEVYSYVLRHCYT
jgi:hypothetical protein